MIRYLRHPEIDKAVWDAQLLRSNNRLWYARSWVLDRMSPGWEALVDDAGEAIMPLSCRSKWGLGYLFQPFGIQQLGVFAPAINDELARSLLRSVPVRFRYWDICLNGAMHIEGTINGSWVEQQDQVLELNRPIDDLRSAYSDGHRRNLKKVDGALRFGSMGAGDFCQLFARTTGARFGKSAVKGLADFEGLLHEGRERGECDVLALFNGDAPVSAACFATWQGRTILLKSANTEQGQEARGMFRIVDEWIARHAGADVLLDFAGSNTPNVARFNAGFGARTTIYLRLVRNLLPAPLRWIKR